MGILAASITGCVESIADIGPAIMQYPHARIGLGACFHFMSDPNARQTAEDLYYAALDLMAEGQLEKAVVAYQESLAADPAFTEAMHGQAPALTDLQPYAESIAAPQRLASLSPAHLLHRS